MKGASKHPTETMLKGLKTLLTALPSEEEKAEILGTLNEAQSFLEDLQLVIEAFPTTESSRGLSEAMSRLDILVDRAGRDDRLRSVMGLRPVGPKARRVNGSDDAEARARGLMQKLDNSESSAIEDILERSGEPLAVLAALASQLGMRTPSRQRKADLIKRIATRIENQRGYRLLRGDQSGLPIGAGASATRG